MAMRLAVSRPLAAAARSTAARAFSTTALRAKEIAGENTETPNMRYAPRNPSETLKRAIVNPVDKYKAKGEALHTYGNYLMSCLPKYIQQFSVWKDELTIYIPPSGVLPVFTFLKNHTAAEYTQISDITAVDYPTKDQRFEVVYNMLSIRHNSRLRVKTYADEATPVPSLCDLYDGANWYEREVYDLFGVFFVGHPDLRRIMTDYGFDGHPLRKDFPMTGYTEIRYDEEKKRIVVEPLEMTQAFRNFRGGSAAWEQVGPGQETTPENFKLPTPKPEPPKEETDIWRKAPSHNAFNAPTHPSTLPTHKLIFFQRARLTFSLPPGNELRQYDQAGLLLHLTKPGVPDDKTKWLKTGIEWYYGKPYISTVGCDAWADWSVVPIPSFTSNSTRPTATIEARRERDVLGKSLWVYRIVRNEDGNEEQIPLREVNWFLAEEEGWSVGVGGYVARPTKEGGDRELDVEFAEGVEIEVLDC